MKEIKVIMPPSRETYLVSASSMTIFLSFILLFFGQHKFIKHLIRGPDNLSGPSYNTPLVLFVPRRNYLFDAHWWKLIIKCPYWPQAI